MALPLKSLERHAVVGAKRLRWIRPRLVPTVAAIITGVICVLAGNWQHHRMLVKEALGAQLAAAASREPIALSSLPPSTDWPALRYRPVEAIGEFTAQRQILIDNKVHAGRAGFYVVTPLLLTDGRYVLVNRGWVPQGKTRAELPKAPPPTDRVSVSGRIATPSPGYFELQQEAPQGPLWQNLDPGRFATATGIDVLPAVIEQTSATGSDDGLIRDWPAPDLGVQTHRIYMMQWYAFAVMVVLLWLLFNRPRTIDHSGH